MKRPDSNRATKRSGDIRKDLTQTQLAWIGSIALAYNEVETLVDFIIQVGLFLHPIGPEVTGRIGGVDGKVELAKLTFKKLGAFQDVQYIVAETLGESGFSLYKRYRDRIIHSRLIHAKSGIARAPAKRGKFEEILLTEYALETLYQRFELLRHETIEILRMAGQFAVRANVLHITQVFPDYLPKRIGQIESEIRVSIAQYQVHHKTRLSLPPLPEFPSELELSAMDEVTRREAQAEIARLMGSHSVADVFRRAGLTMDDK